MPYIQNRTDTVWHLLNLKNMALNSYITSEGLEMGRAQVMQCEAAGIVPSVAYESYFTENPPMMLVLK